MNSTKSWQHIIRSQHLPAKGDGWWTIWLDCGHMWAVLHGEDDPLGERVICTWCDQTKKDAATHTIVSVLVFALLMAGPATAQQIQATGARSADGLWQAATDQALSTAQRRADVTGPYVVAQLNRPALDTVLARVPHETDATRADRSVTMTLPLPDRTFSRFRLEESPILSPELAAAFPAIKTYRGVSLQQPTTTARLDLTPSGLHAVVFAAGQTVYIDPYTPGDLVNHISYDKTSRRQPDIPFRDVVEGETTAHRLYNQLPLLNGTIRRTYRLALAANLEYVNAAGGSQELALARMTTTMNRVNGIYERELAVRLTLSTGTSTNPLALISTNPADYTNNNGTAMLSQNQTRIDTLIGSTNYDIGHVLSTGGGGVANLNAVCNTPIKARGVTGSPNPQTDAFDVDYVAHEIGHQFGANHTFNSNCGGNRSAAHAYEVGSGSTIMAYAGICTAENLQLNSTDLFTFESLNEITAFTTAGMGSTCGEATATGNHLPTVTAAPSYTVPKQTPFTLTASATDENGDALTYLWEEYDLGAASFNPDGASTDEGNRPIFRSYPPTTTPSRTFPSLPYILQHANAPPQTYACSPTRTCLTGEVLPSQDRTMTFQVTVRDQHLASGGVATAQTQVTVNAAMGPFAVTAPNSAVTWTGYAAQTVTWSVNGTEALAGTVRITLSTDGGVTYPVTLLASTPNDGLASFTVPNLPTTAGRIKVEAVGNIFFDVSDVSLTIVAGTAPLQGDLAVDFGPAYGLWLRDNPTSADPPFWIQISNLSPSVTASGDLDGNGTSDLVANFAGFGLWVWLNNSVWVKLHPFDVTHIVLADLDGNGQDDVVVSFPAYGLWVYANQSTWTQLHGLPVTSLASGNIDGAGPSDVVVTFAGYGVFAYLNNTAWAYLHPFDATDIQTGDLDSNGQDDVVMTFPGLGLWVYANQSTWSQLSDLDSAGLTIGNLDGTAGQDVVVNFPGFGVWVRLNTTSWVQLHALNASTLATMDLDGNSQDDLILTFPSYGIWLWTTQSGYMPLHGMDAETVAAGQFDDN